MPPKKKTTAKKGGGAAPPAPAKRKGKRNIEEDAIQILKAGKPNLYKEQLPHPYLLPGVIYKLETPDYFKLLAEKEIILSEFILLLHKVKWRFPPEDSLERKSAFRLRTLIDDYVTNNFGSDDTDKFFQTDKYDLDLEPFECDALDILQHFGNYKIVNKEKLPLPLELVQIVNRAKDADFAQVLEDYPKLGEKDLLFSQPVIKKTTEEKGYGLFAMREYKPGECVALYEGAYTNETNPAPEDADYFASLTCDDGEENDKHFIDGKYNWTLKARGRWVNHASSEEGADNCEFFVVGKGPSDTNFPGRVLTIAAKRHIQVGDEFLVNYGQAYPFKGGMQKPDPAKNVPAFFETYRTKERRKKLTAVLSAAAAAERVPLFFDSEKQAYVMYDEFLLDDE